MSFVETLNALPLETLATQAQTASREIVAKTLQKARLSLEDFAALISPAGTDFLQHAAERAHRLTQQRFGKVIRLFAPLYLSNECVNNCKYCGFSRDNPILRVTLSPDEALREARALQKAGFRQILLVAGEHPKFVSPEYLRECVHTIHAEIPGVALEVGPLDTANYRALVAAGAEGLVVYQETYDRAAYAEMHTSGPKRNFDYRLETVERGYEAGFRRLGIGALLGLSDWRREALCMAAHASYLLRHCWKAQITVSIPRLRPCAGDFQPRIEMSDRHLAQLVCAFRLFLPDVGIVLSTRESPKLRDGLVPLGITLMSAGSHTEPGGYTGAGKEKIHYTQRGRAVPVASNAGDWSPSDQCFTNATGQFEIADHRSPEEIAEVLHRLGYDPLWKDWDAALTA